VISAAEVLSLLFSSICDMWYAGISRLHKTSGLSKGHFSSEYYALNMHASLINSTGDEVVVVTAAITRKGGGLELRSDVSLKDGRLLSDSLALYFGSNLDEVDRSAFQQFVESLTACLLSATEHPDMASALAL
jgi:hypothetical protein